MHFWLMRGLLAGALFGLVDNAWLLVRSYNLPLGYVVANHLSSIVIGAVTGVAIGLWHSVRRRGERPSFTATFVPIATAFGFFWALGPALAAARFRDWSPVFPVAALIGLAVVGAVVGGWVTRRYARSPSPDLSLAVSMILVPLALVGVRELGPAAAVVPAALVLFHGRLLSRELSPGVLLSIALVASIAITSVSFWTMERVDDGLAPSSTAPVEGVDHTNVVVITIDTLRADRLPLHGYGRAVTPSLVRFARDATVFHKAVAPSSWTLPSHASLLTGRAPLRHGADYGANGGPASTLGETAPTLAEILSREGYETAGFVANGAYLHRDFGLARGFETYDDRLERYVGHQPFLASFRWLSFFQNDRWTKAYRPAESVNRAALEWVHTHAAKPFFLFMNYMEPHEPYCPPSPWDETFEGRDYFARDPSQSVLFGSHEIAPETRRHYDAVYDGEIAYVDFAIGEFFDALDALELYDSSLIVVTSDHGEFFGEHDLWGHGVGPYNEVHRVPLLIKLPRSSRVGSFDEWVQLTDVLPTVLTELELPIPPDTDGQPIFRDAGERVAFISGQPNPTRARFGSRFHRSYRGVYLDSWKLTSFSDGARELYNLDADPDESDNLVATETEWLGVLEERLRRHLESIGETPHGSSPDEVDPAVLDRLRSLGYVE